MPELTKILLTSAVTVLGGIIVLVLGQIATRFVIEPIMEYRKVVGSIADALLYYAHFFADSGPRVVEAQEVKEAAERIRRLAVELTAKTITIPGYRFLGRIGVIRPYDVMLKARRALWGLSNSLMRGDWQRKLNLASEAAKALKITAIDSGLFSEDWSNDKETAGAD